MTVRDFVKKLYDIGFNDDTTLNFCCLNHYDGDWFNIELDSNIKNQFDLDEMSDAIYVSLDVDGCTDYIDSKIFEHFINKKEDVNNGN